MALRDGMACAGFAAACAVGLALPAAAEETQTTSSGVIYGNDYVYEGRRNDSYQVRILARVEGQSVFDETFIYALSSTVTQAGLAEARSLRRWNANGAPGVLVWSGPVLTEFYEEFLDSFTDVSTQTVNAGTFVTVQTTYGDGDNPYVWYNDRGSCYDTGTTGATNVEPYDGAFANCDFADEFYVAPGDVNVNTHTTTYINTVERYFTNEDYMNYETYELSAEVVLIGSGHASVQSSTFASGAEFIERLTQQSFTGGRAGLGDAVFASNAGASASPRAVARPFRVWAEGYGGSGNVDGDGAVVGHERSTSGFAGGFVYTPDRAWSFGAAIDSGETEIEAVGAPEQAEVSLTQAGAHVAYNARSWFANAAALYGSGDVEARHGDTTLGGVSVAAYDASLIAIGGEAGRRFAAGGFEVAPSVGADWIRSTTDAFSETGGVALMADENTAERASAWLALTASRTWRLSEGVSFGLSARGRYTRVLSGEDRSLPVAFVGAPAERLTITGAEEEEANTRAGLSAMLGFGSNLALYASASASDAEESTRWTAGFAAAW